MTNTPFQDTVEETLEKFNDINIQWDMAEQIKKYIHIWYGVLEKVQVWGGDIVVATPERQTIIDYIGALEKVDTRNDYPEFYDEHEGEENEDWLTRNAEIMTAIEMCNIDY